MKGVVGIIVALGVAVSVQAYSQTMPDQTWKGKMSDSNCKEKHPAGEHEGKKMTDADCTTVCIKKGAKSVFVSDGKVYQLANQTSKRIATHAGHEVDDRHDQRRRNHRVANQLTCEMTVPVVGWADHRPTGQPDNPIRPISGDGPRPLRPFPHRLPSHRRRPHRALQLALRQASRRHLRAAHRGHRRRALESWGTWSTGSSGHALARARLG